MKWLIAICLLITASTASAEETSTRIWANYVDSVQKMVTEQWKPKGFLESYYAVVGFEVNQDGSLKRIKLEQKSGNSEFDLVALDAVKLAAPFAAMPDTNKPIKIKYYFDYQYKTEDFILDSGLIKN